MKRVLDRTKRVLRGIGNFKHITSFLKYSFILRGVVLRKRCANGKLLRSVSVLVLQNKKGDDKALKPCRRLSFCYDC